MEERLAEQKSRVESDSVNYFEAKDTEICIRFV